MTISAAEQYLIELINRARLDPVSEAARFKIALNQGLPANTLGTQVRQVLAPNETLEDAAIGHSQWMLNTDVFSHAGQNGSTPGQRVTNAGYAWNRVGENISWQGSTAAISLEKMISLQNEALFKSAHHRVNILLDGFREIGVAQEAGKFNSGAHIFNAAMLTENFGTAGSTVFVTGVAYTDHNNDTFYSIGEGQAGVTLSAQNISDTTKAAGGYALALQAGAAVEVTGTVGALDFSATVALDNGNVKFDVVNGTTIFTSGDISLGSGLNHVRLLGAAALEAVGNEFANQITGNAAANILNGADGADTIRGGAGADSLLGGDGADQLYGEAGFDFIQGGAGADLVNGGSGSDRLQGGEGADVITGGLDRDTFVFMAGDGADRITDFGVRTREILLLDDALWGGTAMTEAQVVKSYARISAGSVVFNFGDGDVLTLTGIRSTAGLAAAIDII